MNDTSIFKDIRIIIFIIALFASLIFIHPSYNSQDGFTTNLKYGLDLEGGSWLQLKLKGSFVGVNADPENVLIAIAQPALGNINIINMQTTDILNGQGQTLDFIFTAENITDSKIQSLGLGEFNVSSQGDTNQVSLKTSKELLIQKYLSNSLKTEVVPIASAQGTQYEIRTNTTLQQVQSILNMANGSISINDDGSYQYKDGVSTATRDMTKNILAEKMNALGLKDIPVRTVGDEYILMDFAGIDMTTAREMAEKPGKFEIRIQTQGNETSHVLYGNDIESVGIAGFNKEENMWSTPFTLNNQGSEALRQIAIETGATRDPLSHNLIMLLDDNEIYSAPLSSSAAQQLEQGPIYSWQASTGPDEEGKKRAEQLQIHLRAGALPVNVQVIGAGHVDAILGSKFKTQSLIAGFISLLAVALIVYRKYHQKEILIPMIGTSISELIMILGVAGAIGWQLDLASIAGMIASIGTGIDDVVIITDEVLFEGKLPPTKIYRSRITKAFSIILAAAATVIIAMGPLILMGFGTLKGFAITTIVGVLIGVLITRPVYGKLIHEFLKKDGEGQV